MDVYYNEGIFDEVAESEISELTHQGSVLEPELYEVSGMGDVIVTGDPYELGESLDDCQGDNEFNFRGDCGLVSVTNMLRMAGIEATEDEVVGRAIDLGLVQYSEFNSPEDNGGTTADDRSLLLKSYGINCTFTDDKSGLGSLESIADLVENGHGVNIAINAGYAWNDPSAVGDGVSNHSIIVTGTARDAQTGELKGLYVCDSGLTDKESGSLLLTVDELNECYVDVPFSSALITDDEIR